MNGTSTGMVIVSLALNVGLIFAAALLAIYNREKRDAMNKLEHAAMESRREVGHLARTVLAHRYPEPEYRVLLELNHHFPSSQDRITIKNEAMGRDLAIVQLVWEDRLLRDYLVNARKENGSGWRQYHVSSMWDMFSEVAAIIEKEKAPR